MMKAIIGIDVGGSTTKIVGFRNGAMISPQFVQATDPLTSLYGAFGKFTAENGIELSGIDKVILTGVGSSYVTKPLYGLSCENAGEFDCVGAADSISQSWRRPSSSAWEPVRRSSMPNGTDR